MQSENPYAYNSGTGRSEGTAWEFSNIVEVPSETEPRTPFVLFLEHRDGQGKHPCRMTVFGQYLQIEAAHFSEPLKISREEAEQAITFKRTKLLINSASIGKKYKFRLNKKAKDMELQRARLEVWAKQPQADDPAIGRRAVDNSLVKYCSWLTCSDLFVVGILQFVLFMIFVVMLVESGMLNSRGAWSGDYRIYMIFMTAMVGLFAILNLVLIFLFWKRKARAFWIVVVMYSLMLFSSLGLAGIVLIGVANPNILGIFVAVLVLYHAITGMNTLKKMRQEIAEENEELGVSGE